MSTEAHDKDITIIVNGRKKTVTSKELTFDDPQRGENIFFTITYRRGPDGHKEGSLLEGKSVKVKDGMIFNVTRTDKS